MTVQLSPSSKVLFRPDPIHGQLVIEYDLERDFDAGDLKVFRIMFQLNQYFYVITIDVNKDDYLKSCLHLIFSHL